MDGTIGSGEGKETGLTARAKGKGEKKKKTRQKKRDGPTVSQVAP
jgi:hypothetical protein